VRKPGGFVQGGVQKKFTSREHPRDISFSKQEKTQHERLGGDKKRRVSSKNELPGNTGGKTERRGGGTKLFEFQHHHQKTSVGDR